MKLPFLQKNKHSNLYTTLFAIMAAVIIILGVKQMASVLGPILISVFITILILPLYQWLQDHNLPKSWAVAATVLILVVGVGVLLFVIGASATAFTTSISHYEPRLAESMSETQTALTQAGLPDVIASLNLSSGAVLGVAKSIVSTIASSFSTLLFAVVLSVLMLLEIPRSFKVVVNRISISDSNASHLEYFVQSTISYFFVRLKLNIITGIGFALLLWVLGVDYAILWGLLAVFLSFIPYVGLILAMIPPIILGWAESGWTTVVLIIVGTLIWNLVIENVFQPTMVGKSLRVSPVLVFISVFAFSWLLGPIGIFVSMPLTIAVMLLLSAYPESRWIAQLMGQVPDFASPTEKPKE